MSLHTRADYAQPAASTYPFTNPQHPPRLPSSPEQRDGEHTPECNAWWEQLWLEGRNPPPNWCICPHKQAELQERSRIAMRTRGYDRDRVSVELRAEGLSQIEAARVLRLAVYEDDPMVLEREDRRLWRLVHRIAKRLGVILANMRGIAISRQTVRAAGKQLKKHAADVRHWWYRRRHPDHLTAGSLLYPGSGERSIEPRRGTTNVRDTMTNGRESERGGDDEPWLAARSDAIRTAKNQSAAPRDHGRWAHVVLSSPEDVSRRFGGAFA